MDALMAGVFQRLACEWDGYRAEVHTYIADATAFGVYSRTYKATGKSMVAAFAHLYELKEGKIIRMQQHVDTAIVHSALG